MEAKESYSVLPGGMEPVRVTSIPEEVPVLQDLQPPVVISCLLTSSLELGPGLACRGLSSAWMDHFGSALAIRSHPSAPALPEEKEASTHLFLTYVQIKSLSFKFQLGHLIPRSTKSARHLTVGCLLTAKSCRCTAHPDWKGLQAQTQF